MGARSTRSCTERTGVVSCERRLDRQPGHVGLDPCPEFAPGGAPREPDDADPDPGRRDRLGDVAEGEGRPFEDRPDEVAEAAQARRNHSAKASSPYTGMKCNAM